MTSIPPHRPLTIAHRSANDLGRLRAATALGVDFHECDVWLYQGRVEIRHEKTLGRLPIRWDRWKLEWRGPPRLVLARLLEDWEGPGTLLLDLKGRAEALPGKVLDTFAAAGQDIPFAVTARTWSLLEPFLWIPGVATFPSVGSTRNMRDLLAMDQRPWSGVSVHRKLLSAEAVRRLRTVGPVVTTWPVNSMEAFDEAMGYGVDGISSDSLDVLAEVRKRRPRHAAEGPGSCEIA